MYINDTLKPATAARGAYTIPPLPRMHSPVRELNVPVETVIGNRVVRGRMVRGRGYGTHHTSPLMHARASINFASERGLRISIIEKLGACTVAYWQHGNPDYMTMVVYSKAISQKFIVRKDKAGTFAREMIQIHAGAQIDMNDDNQTTTKNYGA